MNNYYDAVIIGGGVIGGSIAYEMAKRGRKVIILEKGRIAAQSSGAAAGMLAAQVEMGKETGPLFHLAIKSRAMFPSLAHELKECSGIDVGIIHKGMLRIAFTEEEKLEFAEIIAYQRKVGQQGEWLSGDDVRRKEKSLSADILGAMYVPNDGQILAPELTQAFIKSAVAMGAEIREFCEVRSLLFEGGRLRGIQSQEGCVFGDHVVIAAGAWSSQFMDLVGPPLLTYPVKGECFSVTTDAPLLQSTVFSHGCYLVPKRGGRLLVGATMKEHTFDQRVTFESLNLLMDRAKRILPGIAHAEWEKGWAGIRPQTVDGLPFLGKHPEYSNLIFATGHFRNGILLSAVTGQLIADLIEEKNLDGIDLNPFALDRHARTLIGG